jgi:hypothetical protein
MQTLSKVSPAPCTNKQTEKQTNRKTNKQKNKRASRVLLLSATTYFDPRTPTNTDSVCWYRVLLSEIAWASASTLMLFACALDLCSSFLVGNERLQSQKVCS